MGRWLRAAALVLGLAPLVAGCGLGPQPLPGLTPRTSTILYVAIGVGDATRIDSTLRSALGEKLEALEKLYADLRPGVKLELLIFEEERLLAEVRRRTRSGLAPDLILAEGSIAQQLHQEGLTRTVPFPNPSSDQLSPSLIPFAQVDARHLFAVPVGYAPQLACFDRRRMAQPPATMQALLTASSEGQSFGFKLDLGDLAWTLGSLGALESFTAIRAGSPATEEHVSRIRQWLLWLQTANLQQRITLAGPDANLGDGLLDGTYAWITCRSSDQTYLHAQLGDDLGLAPLPAGSQGQPSPVSVLLMWAYGRNSSPVQRQAAEELVRFSLNPPVQRAMTLRGRTLLPVSREAPLPVASSTRLAALVTAQQQAQDARARISQLLVMRNREEDFNRILIAFHYGNLGVDEATDALVRLLQSPSP
ncbi:ABC transporter substrate-binding protein [Cyanobium sp. CH-040]|uniref:ABC transporter substrate-binding protein n=1 Tax=Cyanobium sp. CH-040 TaxID=2823708 RepID=UPI0020CD642E|nr:ABC transporter substrate-binding protein [Cyanobium sp. CH-040]MCP9928245.1 carbohydrate ABC transporter substrate-binding protein [Cyanobium sp. CH-040]